MNVGEARGSLIINGLDKTIKDLQFAKRWLEALNIEERKSRNIVKQHIEEVKKLSPTVAKVVGENTRFRDTLKSINAGLNEQNNKLLRQIKLEETLARVRATTKIRRDGGFATWSSGVDTAQAARRDQVNAVKDGIKSRLSTPVPSGFAGWSKQTNENITKINAETAELLKKFKLLSVQSPFDKFNAGLRRFTQTLNAKPIEKVIKPLHGVSTQIKSLTARIRENMPHSAGWLQRFGLVAAGFWIAYRAINAVEYAISNLTQTFTGGAEILNEYVDAVAQMSGMIALISTGGTYMDRYAQASEFMNATIKEFVRISPRYGLSMESISNGLQELAQFGVVVRKDMVESTAATFSLIDRIATTVGSSAKQVRQEIQSIFTGQARVTDQVARMIRNVMPELWKQLKGHSLTAQQKWELMISKFGEFKHAVEEANKSLRMQTNILRNNLSIISGKSLESSGIFALWVKELREINERLITADGKFGDLGTKMYEIFYRVWQVIQRTVDALKLMLDFAGGIIDVFRGMSSELRNTLLSSIKWAVALAAIKGTLGLIVSLVKGLKLNLIISGIGAISRGLGIIAGTLVSRVLPAFIAMAPTLIPVTAAVAGIAAAIYVLPAALSTASEGAKLLGNIIKDHVGYWVDWARVKWHNFVEMVKHPIDKEARNILSDPNLPELINWEKELEKLKNSFVDYLKADTKALKDLMSESFDSLVSKAKGLLDILGDIISNIHGVSTLKDKFSEAKSQLSELKGIGEKAFDGMGDRALALFSKLDKIKAPLIDPDQNPLNVNIPRDGDEDSKTAESWLKTRAKLFSDILKSSMDQFEAKTYDARYEAQELLDKFKGIAGSSEIINYWLKLNEASIRREKTLYQEELRVRNALADLDLRERISFVSREDSLKAQIALQQDLLKVYRDSLSQVAPNSQEYLTLMDKLSTATRTLASDMAELNRLSQSTAEGMTYGFRRAVDELPSAFAVGETASRSIIGSMQQGWKDFFYSTKDGLRGVEDAFLRFTDNLLKAFTDMIGEMSAKWMASAFMNMFIPSGAGSFGPGNDLQAANAEFSYASGGVIPEPVFGYGMRSGKSYSFAENGPETVIANGGTVGVPNINFALNVKNESSARVNASQSAPRFDGEKFVIDVILKNADQNGKLRGMFRS